MKRKFKWQVEPAPTGQFRSFRKRGWPLAIDKDTEQTLAKISSKDEYIPKNVKTGNHAEITVSLAFVSGNGFVWRRLKDRFANIKDAKTAAETFINENPQHFLKE